MRGSLMFLFVGILFTAMAAAAFGAHVQVEKFEQLPVPAGENFIVNGDFEKDTDGDGMPDEWGGVEHWVETTKALVKRVKMPDGNHVLFVRFLTDGGCVINYLLREKSRYFRPAGAVMIHHTLRVKHNGYGYAYGHAIGAEYRGVGGTRKAARKDDWRTVGGVYRYDPAKSNGIAMVRIYIKSAEKGDTYWFDDYDMRTVSEAEAVKLNEKYAARKAWKLISPVEAAKAKGAEKGNLLHDSSFESNPGFCRVRDGMKWWALGGEPTEASAFHGRYAMRDRAVSDPYLFREGVPHTISLYAKGPDGGKINVKVTDTYSRAQRVSQTFNASGEWKRCSFSFVPFLNEEAAVATFKVIINAPGSLIDAVQIEEGGLTDYAPVDATELFLLLRRRPDRSNVAFFYDGEEIPVLATVQKAGPAEAAADVVVLNFWNKEIRRTPVKVSIGAVAGHAEVKIPPLARGAYKVYLEGKGARSRSIQFGVISRELAKGSEIAGASHETGRVYNRDFIKAIGVTWTRHHSAYSGPYWGRPADVPWLGPNYFESTDKFTAEKAWNPKLRHWGSFVYPPEPWRSTLKKISGTEEPLPEGFFKTHEEYFKAAVGRFKKTIKYWECWNEPTHFTPKQYLQMLAWFNKTIKRLDPAAAVVGFSGFLSPGSWKGYMVPLMKMGALEHCDVISYHGYFNNWPEERLWNKLTLAEHLDLIRKYTAAAGKPDMPIWDNEFTLWGRSWYDKERTRAGRRASTQHFGYRRGAAFIVHYVTIGYAHGVRHFGPHCFDHDQAEQGQGPIEYDQRAFEYDYGLKPKAISFAVVCNKMQDAKLVSEKADGDVLVYVFDKPAGSLAVVFMRRGRWPASPRSNP